MTDNNTIEVTLPNNKYTMEFVGLHLRDREKCIELGLSFLHAGERILQNKDNFQFHKQTKKKLNLLGTDQGYDFD